MKQKFILCFIILVLPILMIAQKPSKQYTNPELIKGEYLGETPPLSEFVMPEGPIPVVKGEKLGYHPKDDWILNEQLNPNALPQGPDPVWQKSYAPPRTASKTINQNFDGIGYSNVNPPDPALDVGPNHVIQMINGSGGALLKIWDRAGNQLQGQVLMSSFAGTNGGLGDPIVLYDQLADRWLISEFASSGNFLLVAISTTNDPLGTWHVYSYQTPSFPDYPKYGVWPNAYIVTTNEADPTIYALDRNSMLSGSAGVSQRFTVPSYGTIGFQALTPVDFDGTTQPPADEPGIVMRMADDAWDPNLNQDQLEIFEFDIDWNTPANTTLTEVQNLATSPFDTELCGYTSFACIQQQGSNTTLDPLREVIMNRIMYRRFPGHEAMVLSHVTDVNGNDRAGVRWYELRRNTPAANWSIYQEGTYSPDSESRWMSAIGINADGSIGLAYNVSSSNSFPSLKYTGRLACDPLGTMSVTETDIVIGSAANASNRYGDYSAMTVDPVDGSFWFTGEYNPASQWSTRVVNFSLGLCGPAVQFTTDQISVSEESADVPNSCLDYKEVTVTIEMAEAATVDPTVTLNLSGSAIQDVDYEAPANLSATLTASNLSADFIFKIFNDDYVEMAEQLVIGYTLNANGGDAYEGGTNQTLDVDIISDDEAPENLGGSTIIILTEDFEGGTLGSFTTNNPSGDTPFQAGTNTDATSSAFTVPAPPSGTTIAWINDDACDCDQNMVYLTSPVIDLSSVTSASLLFDYFYEDNSWQGNQEDFDVEISTNGGSSFTLLEDISGVNAWTPKTINLDTYAGQSSVQIRFVYSDGTGWLYGLTVDNISVRGSGNIQIQTAVNSGNPDEAYLGPNEEVHFYDPVSGNVMLSINNTSSHDFGCTTVEVDRQGTNPTVDIFSTNNPMDYVTSKSFKIVPTNNSSSADYELELYYNDNEIVAWETGTSNQRATDLSIVKVSGNNQISDVTPANAGTFDINYFSPSLNAFGNEVIVKANVLDGFSGFALGKEVVGSSCESFPTNTWIGPSTGNWNDSPANWSLGELPDYCHLVIIPNGNEISIQAGQIGKAFTLDVPSGASLQTVGTGELDVVAPN